MLLDLRPALILYVGYFPGYGNFRARAAAFMLPAQLSIHIYGSMRIRAWMIPEWSSVSR